MDDRSVALLVVGVTLAVVGVLIVIAFRQFGLKYLSGPRREQLLGLPIGAVAPALPQFQMVSRADSGYLFVLVSESYGRLVELCAALDAVALTTARNVDVTLLSSVAARPIPVHEGSIEIRPERPLLTSVVGAWVHSPDDDSGLLFATLGVPSNRGLPFAMLFDKDRTVLAKGELSEPGELSIFLERSLRLDLTVPDWTEVNQRDVPVESPPDPFSEDRVVDVVERYLDAFNRQDAAALAATFGPTGQLAVGKSTLRGRDAIEAFFSEEMFSGDNRGLATTAGPLTVHGRHVYVPVLVSHEGSEAALSLDFMVEPRGIALLRI
jgi:hypothetical protein